MQELALKATILHYHTCRQMVIDLNITADDLILTNQYIYGPYFAEFNLPCQVIFQEEYGAGEPSDDMTEAIYKDIQGNPKRIIAIGGGTIIDLAKFFCLKNVIPVLDLYDGIMEAVKERELVIVPTTCGTGSEVTNVAVLSLNGRNMKKGLAVEAFYADKAILVPELLQTLPSKVFATSSIDALVHAVESALSPKASETTKIFSYKAIEKIIGGYIQIRERGIDARFPLQEDFLMASTYAGIAFGNAGCAAVHAMSYPLGAMYHVAHGESNYAMFTGVMKTYMQRRQDGEISRLNAFIANLLDTTTDRVYEELETLLNVILPKKPLHEYGVKESDLKSFANSVATNQKRLTDNNFVPLKEGDYLEIYQSLY